MSNTISYEKAQAELAALVSEQATLPHKLAEAVHAGDASAILKAQKRNDELPAYVFVAKSRMLKARLADLEARKTQLAEERAPVFAEIEEAARRVREAKAALADAQQALQNTKSAEYDISYQIGRTKIELERLIAENSNAHAPVVRSLPHVKQAGAEQGR
jgi:chromosome segregation ATPase